MRIAINHFCSIALLAVMTACGSGTSEVDFARSLGVKAPAEMVLRGGKIITMDGDSSVKEALAIRDGRFIAVGTNRDMRPFTGPRTRIIELAGRTVIPGLIDSHVHATSACLNWDEEIHWERTRSLIDGLRQIESAAKASPPGTWVVVGGGWVPTQFAERRFPSRAELDAIAPQHPVYIQYLNQGALLNSAALAAAGITRASADPPGGRFERNPSSGDLTGWLQSAAAWELVYDKIPRAPLNKARESLKNCFHELNRLAITSVGDLHGRRVGFAQRRLLNDMRSTGDLTVRISFYLGASDTGDAVEQLRSAMAEIKQLPQNDMFRFAGFYQVLPNIGDTLADPKAALTPAAREKFRRLAQFFAESERSFRVEATHDAGARQLLDILEEVNAATPFAPRRIGFAHLESATAETVARIKKLGGGISVQDRLVMTGERNAELWGLALAREAPPLRAMLESGVPLGAGSDGFRAVNYSPMLSLWWLVTGKTVAGTALREHEQNLTREEALRLYTVGSAWFSFEEGRKGSIEPGKLADLAVLNADYITVPDDQIRALESLLTVVGGRVVYAAEPYKQVEKTDKHLR